MQIQNTSPSEQQGPEGLLWADRWLAKAEDLFDLIAAIAISILMGLGVVQVLGRQLFDSQLDGYIDMVELLMATFVFMGIAYCQRLDGHVRMDLFVRLMKGRMRWVVEFITTFIPLFLIGILIYFSWEHFVRSYESGDSTIDMEYPFWPSKLVVPISFVLLFLRLLIQSIGYWRLVLHPNATPVVVPLVYSEEEQALQQIEASKKGDKNG
ncbi:TRAP transporter small permease [Orrella sp. 11846]|uniref:TRAP transporter small permease n=1 Tax=Orrella sp. 11846 TaxID=3409913 RepID=UPI003B59783D